MIIVYSQSTNITKYSYHSTHTARYLVRLLSSKIVDIRKKPLDYSSNFFLDGIRESAPRAFRRCANRYPIRITLTRDLFSGRPYFAGAHPPTPHPNSSTTHTSASSSLPMVSRFTEFPLKFQPSEAPTRKTFLWPHIANLRRQPKQMRVLHS